MSSRDGSLWTIGYKVFIWAKGLWTISQVEASGEFGPAISPELSYTSQVLAKFLFGLACLRGFTSESKMTDNQTLLAEYARNGSESAFRELVTRYINLVYSTALRLVGGDTHWAEDVTQTVFISLARRSRTLSGEVMLGGWLYQSTYHVATKSMRAERRRQIRESEAVQMNALQDDSGASLRQVAPILDEAITQLGTEDRAAILLRFFEQRDFRSVGAALGSNEDAARMRVSRALEKLHSILKRRGFTLSAAALGTALASEAVIAAPAGLAVSISTTALVSAAVSGGTLTFLKIMAMTKLKVAVSAVVVAGVGTTLVLEYQTQKKLRDENASLRQQIEQLASVQEENRRLSNLQASSQLPKEQFSELLRLRGQIGGLRNQTNELGKLQAENRQLRSSLANTGRNLQSATQPQATAPGYYPKESWNFAGYADPESAFQSALCAQRDGDVEKFLASVAPEERARMLERSGGKPEGVIGAKDRADMEKIAGFQVVNKEAISADEVHLDIYADGLSKTQTFSVKLIGNEWKVVGTVKSRSPAQN
jgi:RNA polymerase sigma factor (sigma-70 family)